MNQSEKIKSLALAEHYFRSNNYELAEHFLKIVIKSDSNNSKANELLAYIYGNKGDLDTSFQLLEKSCIRDDCSPEALYYLGASQLKRYQYEKAAHSLKKSMKIAGVFFEALHDLGTVYAHLGKTQEALSCYQNCLKFNEKSHELYFNMAKCLDDLQRHEEALSHYDKAIQLKPNHPEAWYNKSMSLNDLKRYEDALSHYDKAIQLKPDFPEAWSNKGVTLNNLKRYEEALSHYDKAIQLKPDYPEVWSNKGVTLNDLKRYEEALSHYDKAIQLNPDFFDAYRNKSLTYLCIGDFENGWKFYNFRFKRGNSNKYRHHKFKELESLDNLTNKNILVWYEQGLGDTIQFSRYIPKLIELGVNVTFEVQKPLLNLFVSQFSCTVTSEIKKDSKFDFQIPLLSLPKLFGTNLETTPSPISIIPAPEDIFKWKRKLNLSNKKLNIGLAISGNPKYTNDSNRSMNLGDISPLLDCGQFFLIQKEINEIDFQNLNQYENIKFLGNEINDFIDTTAIIMNMDLIISVDTSLIHLAGSLNRKSYLMLPWRPEWRWLLDRTDSPWYPSIKIFRQKSIGDWDSVVQKIKKDLFSFYQ